MARRGAARAPPCDAGNAPLASAQSVRLWDSRSGKCIRILPAHSDPVTAVEFDGVSGDMLVSGSWDGLWSAASCRAVAARQCTALTRAAAVCGKRAAGSAFTPSSATRTHPCTRRRPCAIGLRACVPRARCRSCVRFTPNGQYLLMSTLDGSHRLWDFKKLESVRRAAPHERREISRRCASQEAKGVHRPHEQGAPGSRTVLARGHAQRRNSASSPPFLSRTAGKWSAAARTTACTSGTSWIPVWCKSSQDTQVR
jgi:WD40 repeat protein